MDVTAASAVNLYNYQTTSQSSGQSAAVLQALTQVYSSAKAGSDPMANVLTTASMAPVVDAIYSLSKDSGTGTIPAEALQAYVPYGGVNAASASALFASASPSAASTQSGFDSELTSSTSLALTAYQANLNYGTTAKPAAQAASSTDIQQAVQASQASTFASTLNLIG